MISTLFSTNDIRNRFDRETAGVEQVDANQRCAAVAMIFHQGQNDLNLCFGLRATYEGDPWSGDMAFPGGKADPEDETFHRVAQRETFEEIGFELSDSELVGGLGTMQLYSNKRRAGMLLKPMIYILDGDPAPFEISNELDEAFWIPVNYLWHPSNWIEEHVQWQNNWYPGVQFRSQVIWGLTLRILTQFGQALNHPLFEPKRVD